MYYRESQTTGSLFYTTLHHIPYQNSWQKPELFETIRIPIYYIVHDDELKDTTFEFFKVRDKMNQVVDAEQQ